MSALRHLLFRSPWLYRFMRIIVGSIFVWAGAIKLMDPRAFARILSNYELVPEAFLVPVAIGLPAVEFLAGLGLAFDVRGSLKIISGLLLLFALALGYGIFNDMNVDCGCFSAAEVHAKNSLRVAFFRDLGLLLVVLYLFMWRWVRKRSDDGYGFHV